MGMLVSQDKMSLICARNEGRLNVRWSPVAALIYSFRPARPFRTGAARASIAFCCCRLCSQRQQAEGIAIDSLERLGGMCGPGAAGAAERP